MTTQIGPDRTGPKQTESNRTCPGGSGEESSLGYLGAEVSELLGLLEELHKLHDFLFCLIDASHVFESHLYAVLLHLLSKSLIDDRKTNSVSLL